MQANTATVGKPPKPLTLLVVGGSPKINWYEQFKGCKVANADVVVEMAHWDEINLVSYTDSSDVICNLSASAYPIPGTSMTSSRTCTPDFILIRSACRGVAGQDWRNILYGFMHASLPSLNSLDSYYMCQEKPIVMGKLHEIKRKLGADVFPVIEQSYYSSWRTMTFASQFPLVAKVGTAHAGFGKMRVMNPNDFEDFRSVCALQHNYVVAEPFIDWDYDFRIQKIGSHYRAFKRTSDNWKGKGMSQNDVDIEVTPKFRLWIDEAAKAIGMDICALDGVHSKDGKEYILELNDSAIGLNRRYEAEDLQHIRDLVLVRMTQEVEKRSQKDSSSSSSSSSSSPAQKKSVQELEDRITKLQLELEQERNARVALSPKKSDKDKKEKTGGWFK